MCDGFPIAIDGPAGAAVDLGAGLPGSNSPGAHLPGADLPDEPSGNAYVASQAGPVDIDPETTPARVRFDAAREAIEVGLPDASPLDREIWLSELKNQTPEDIREILSLHRRLSPPPTLQESGRPGERDGLRLISTEAPQPRLLEPRGSTAPTGFSADAVGLLESSIKAIQSAEQVILNNIANSSTIGFKRARVLFGDESYRHVALPGQIDQEGRPTTSGISLGGGTRILANQID